jgi:hypothetical protein
VTVRLTAFFLATFSITGFCLQASAADDPDIAAPAPAPVVNVVPAASDIVIETQPWAAITLSQRLAWFDEKTFGIYNLAGAIPGAAFNTLRDSPKEAGSHWSGFGERYGVSVSTNGLSNAMEAGLGAAWGEDPRYFRAGAGNSFKSRLGHVVKWTVMAPDRNGDMRPAYARIAAFGGSSFISDAWREPSDATTNAGFTRFGLAFAGRMGSNTFDEFWPDFKRKVFHHGTKPYTQD